ncbi:MAG: 2-hydroxychromene-2-carboxylate isomerase [bacterium]
MALEFWFEFASTYSYPAAMRVEELARSQGVPLVWKAMLLGPIFRAQGWNDSPFNLYPAKGRYMWRDLERICAGLAIPFRRPTQFPRNSLLAARIACRFGGEPWLEEFVRSVFRANFAEDQDIADPTVLAGILERLDQPAGAVLEEAQSPESKEKLRMRMERAAALGIFGAPTFVAGEELFWGNDRLEAALSWYRERGQDERSWRAGPLPMKS